MGEPPTERYSTFNSKGLCKLFQTLSLWAITDYGEVRCTGSQKLRRASKGEIASLKRDEASHKDQLEFPIARGAGSRLIREEGRIDPDLCGHEKKTFPMHSELRVRM